MIVKICGIQSVPIAQQTVKAGASWLGFVFANSSRRVTPERAKEIIDQLPETAQTVGVFVNETAKTMNEIAEFTKLNIIQLHGDESIETIEQIKYPTIKAFPVDQIDAIDLTVCPADYILIDSPRSTYFGGTGKAFDWSILQQLPKQLKEKIILAGGLNAKNVQQAITTVHPIGVDVSSGVETEGRKDIKKITKFIRRVNKLSEFYNDKSYFSNRKSEL